DDEPAEHRRALLPVFLLEAARRPVVVPRVAATRAVQGSDVLQRDQDVPVQLDVGDVLHVAVRRQDPLLVFAAEEGDVHLLPFVLVGVVLHARPQSIGASFPSPATYLATVQFGTAGMDRWSRT